MAVKTGIKFTNTLVRATPTCRTAPANNTKATTDAKTDNISKAVIASPVTFIV